MAAPVIIIYGVTGDLSKRKLLPALYHLFEQEVLPSDTKVIGVSRRDFPVEDFLHAIEESVNAQKEDCRAETLSLLSKSIDTIKIDPENEPDYTHLKAKLDTLDKGGKRNRLFYMSIPPAAYEPIVRNLSKVGLNTEQDRILLEKPFGYNLASAEQTVAQVHEAFSENQIYRIDHYLAKETAQNLLAFRMHNPIFLPLWSNEHIDSVHVCQSETLGIEGRANFYEQTGALRDMIQSHLMQLLALTLMEVPADMTSEAIHEAKQEFFKNLRPASPKDAIRGQYNKYKDEVGNPSSTTETYVKLKLSSNDPKWKDTEIILEHGKALSETIADIRIAFKTPHERRRNSLSFQIQPNEGISLDLVVKEPGFETVMKHASLDFRYKNTFKDAVSVDAYERVLMDAVRGDQSLFASDEEVLTTWKILQPLLDAWEDNDNGLRTYDIGSNGPA